MCIALIPPTNKTALPSFGTLNNPKYSMIEILLRRLLVNIKSGKITFVFDNGYKMVFSGEAVGPEGIINVHSIKGLQRLGTAGYLGLAEGFLAGEWTTPSLPNLFAFGTEKITRSSGLVETVVNPKSNSISKSFMKSGFNSAISFLSPLLPTIQ